MMDLGNGRREGPPVVVATEPAGSSENRTFQRIVAEQWREMAAAVAYEACPDQYVGTIGGWENPYRADFPTREPVTARPAARPAIIVVLESPRGDEFDDPRGPAKGRIGLHLRVYLEEIVADRVGIDDIADHGLIIMHAVQYQCSLGLSGPAVRSEVFRRVWRSFGRESFKARFVVAFRPGDVVVNACPRGDSDDAARSVRRLVEQAIADVRQAGSDVRIAHPQFWSVPRNRALHWE